MHILPVAKSVNSGEYLESWIPLQVTYVSLTTHIIAEVEKETVLVIHLLSSVICNWWIAPQWVVGCRISKAMALWCLRRNLLFQYYLCTGNVKALLKCDRVCFHDKSPAVSHKEVFKCIHSDFLAIKGAACYLFHINCLFHSHMELIYSQEMTCPSWLLSNDKLPQQKFSKFVSVSLPISRKICSSLLTRHGKAGCFCNKNLKQPVMKTLRSMKHRETQDTSWPGIHGMMSCILTPHHWIVLPVWPQLLEVTSAASANKLQAEWKQEGEKSGNNVGVASFGWGCHSLLFSKSGGKWPKWDVGGKNELVQFQYASAFQKN